VEAASGPPARPPHEVALDGIDELVERMLCYDVEAYAEVPGDGQRIAIDDGDAGWTVTLDPSEATFTRAAVADADARVSGDPSDLLLALWNRLPYDDVTTVGDQAALSALRAAIANATL
jgi:hypothetical protein